MVRWLADENFDSQIVRAVRRHWPAIDILRAQDAGLTKTPDDKLLAWCALNERVLLTLDFATLLSVAKERVERGERRCGVFGLRPKAPIWVVAEQIAVVTECSLDGEWEGRIAYLPF